MVIVGAINAYEFETLKERVHSDAKKTCKKDRRAAAFVGAFTGVAVGLALTMILPFYLVDWRVLLLIPTVFALIGAIVGYANQCAETDEEDYCRCPASCRYYNAINGKTVLKERLDIGPNSGSMLLTVSDRDGIVHDIEIGPLNVATKTGIVDNVVDLSAETIYVPYTN